MKQPSSNLSSAFNTCLCSGKYAQRVQQDQREGYLLDVTDSPALFINGRYPSGALALSNPPKMVDEEIRLSSLKKTSSVAETHKQWRSVAAQNSII